MNDEVLQLDSSSPMQGKMPRLRSVQCLNMPFDAQCVAQLHSVVRTS